LTAPFFTIGHSKRAIETFVALLQGARVEPAAAIRTAPRSRANRQFNTDFPPVHTSRALQRLSE